MKVEGYWRDTKKAKKNETLPWPEVNQLGPNERKEIAKLIEKKEKTASIKHYKGWSNSRITKEKLGSREFVKDQWTWPEDFRTHYVLEHGVKPSKEFLKWIGYSS